LRTSSFADFATKIVPKGAKSTGYFNQIWNGLPTLTTFRKDVMLTGERDFLFFSQDFKTVVDRSNVSLPGWANIIQTVLLHGVADFRLGMDMLNFIFQPEYFLMRLGDFSKLIWMCTPRKC
jgi:hypothetical protein